MLIIIKNKLLNNKYDDVNVFMPIFLNIQMICSRRKVVALVVGSFHADIYLIYNIYLKLCASDLTLQSFVQ